jgi:hypothetical protein
VRDPAADDDDRAFATWLAEGRRPNSLALPHDVAKALFAEQKARRAADARRRAEREAAARARDDRERDVAALARRLRHLEALLLDEDGRLDGLMVPLLRGVFAEVETRIAEAIEKRAPLTYCGVWDEQRESYPAGSMVTCAGSAWIAVAPAAKGDRPARAAPWKLAAKGFEPPARSPGVA